MYIKFSKINKPYIHIIRGYYAYETDEDSWEDALVRDEKIQPAGYYKVCNIYDMAGNVQEWTMETTLEQSETYYYTRNSRGGSKSHSGSWGPASVCDIQDLSETSEDIGFRIALYVK